MNAKPIIFRKGEENGIVVERDHFENSIMLNQYQQAVDIFNRQWKQQYAIIDDFKKSNGRNNNIWIDNKFSNIIAFCGDRGEGKSSCMASFATILTDEEVRKNAVNAIVPYSLDPKEDSQKLFHGLEDLLSTDKIEWLDVIDPSFFDDDHNLLELLLGRICEKANQKNKAECENDCTINAKHRKLMEQLEKVKRCITTMTPQKDKKIFDSVESISELAAGMQLKDELQTLFNYYLQFVGKECLLICVDDLDLGFKQGFKMAEMLRKYLINPYCVVLVSVKVEQLIDIIATEHKHKVKDTDLDWEYCKQVAQKYVAKLLPRSNRVPMPAIEDICERRIQIADSYRPEDDALKELTVKERVVQLIFQKTGYVFYNTQFLSPIVPTNLRNLRHLLSTFDTLPDSRNEDGSDNEIGREVFKDYFFRTWVTTLSNEDQKFARQVSDHKDISTFNAFVVEYFAKRVKASEIEIKKREGKVQLGSTHDEEAIDIYDGDYAPLYLNITNRTNSSANISLGDVMYIVWLVSTITVDKNLQNLIFFIKTLYSMRLYACYNESIDDKDASLYPELTDKADVVTIHKADKQYEHVNRIQRLVNGSYFSYPQGALLANDQDRCKIDFNQVKDLFKLLKSESKKSTGAQTINYTKILNMCEYLALCISRTSTEDNVNDEKNYSRQAKSPTFLGVFNSGAGFAIFDFLLPFYSLCNIKYAYHRFDEILSDNPKEYRLDKSSQQNVLFSLALKNPNSLLNQMKKNIREGKYDKNWDMHGLVSDAIIRVVDVQWAIFDELLRQYRTHRVGAMMNKIHLAYEDIQKLNITLYRRLVVKNNQIEQNHGPHQILFEFLHFIDNKVVCVYKNDSVESAIKKLLETNDPAVEKNKKVESAEAKQFVQQIDQKFEEIQVWPISGDRIKQVIKDTASLKSNQKSSFSSRIGKIWKSTKEYNKEEIKNQYDIIKEVYLIAKSK